MKKFALWFIVIILVSWVKTSQAKSPHEFTEEFFARLQVGEISAAYDQLFAGSSIPRQKPQAVELLKRQTASGLPLYGKIVGFEKIRTEKIGRSITRLVYVLKLE